MLPLKALSAKACPEALAGSAGGTPLESAGSSGALLIIESPSCLRGPAASASRMLPGERLLLVKLGMPQARVAGQLRWLSALPKAGAATGP